MAGLPVFGGPLDGTQAKAIGGRFVFLTQDTDPKRASPSLALTEDSHVYIKESTRYRFAGHAHRVCGCGAHLTPVKIKNGPPRPVKSCRLCGASVAQQPRRS